MSFSMPQFETIIATLRSVLKDFSSNQNKTHSNKNFIERQRQQIQLLFDLETSMTELRLTITDPFVKGSEDCVADVCAYMMSVIEKHSDTPNAVIQGSQQLKGFFKSVMESKIQPSDYDQSIPEYIDWQNKTIEYFVTKFWPTYSKNHLTEEKSARIEQAWNWNERTNEPIFLGGAARPLFPEKITNFSDLLSSYYNRLDPLYLQNRSHLFDVLNRLVREEGGEYWKNYHLCPSTTSTGVLEQCLSYFYFRDRTNTFFINSSASDYLPFVHLAQQIFDEDKFVGSPMTDPKDFNTQWILEKLLEDCANICNKVQQSQPTIIVLLTSKNRFGARIDVDQIHQKLNENFVGKIVTIVDACQDGRSFLKVDVILYSKRFTTTGAIALLNKRLINAGHDRLREKLALGTNFPIIILAQTYVNINMMNKYVAFGVEDLINSANWTNSSSPVLRELRSVFGFYTQGENCVSSVKIEKTNGVQYEFTEDELGTIITIRLSNETDGDDERSLSRLTSKLKEQGHTLDSFLMNDPFLESRNAIQVDEVKRLVETKDLEGLRRIEAKSSAYLAWPLVPFSVHKSSRDSISEEHFNRCQAYHRCLRISIDRSGHPGKLKRFVDILEEIVTKNELTSAIVQSEDFSKHSSQWPSND